MALFERIFRRAQRVVRDVRFLGMALVLLVLLIKILEYNAEARRFNQTLTLDRVMRNLYSDIRSEIVSVALAVLLIEWLSQRRITRMEKSALILQLGSPDNVLAREAVRLLHIRGWLSDGTLRELFLVRGSLSQANLWRADLRDAELMYGDFQGANLHKANLARAKLWEANFADAELMETNLSGANLHHANLQRAKLWDADLRQASLDYADLRGANLRHADLQDALLIHARLHGVEFLGANLAGVRLVNAEFDETTILPDGTKWTTQTDLKRFTDPTHANFWQYQPRKR